MKKIIGFIFSTLFMCLLIPNVALAADEQWITNKYEDWTYVDDAGTNINAKVVDGILYVTGTGAVPSYTMTYKRPWDGHSIFEIYVDKGITSIGKNAFNDMDYVTHVEFYSNTYVEGSNSFDIYNGGRIIIKGTDIANRTTGKIAYTSIDSIAEFVHANCQKYEYVFDNMYMINMVKSGYNDIYRGISPLDAITTATNENYPYINYNVKISTDEGNGRRANISYCRPNEACRTAFEAFMGDYNYMASYTVLASQYLKYKAVTEEPWKYTITIPNAYKFPNREFKVLQILPGVVNVLDDLDDDPETITFETDHPQTIYAVVYKDHFELLTAQ